MKKMPKNSNVIQFSLPVEVREKLEAMGTGESVALVAKRLLLDFLAGENSEVSTAIAPDALEEIRDRLTELEKHRNDQQETRDFLEKTMNEKRFDLLEQYGDRLNQLETGQPELHETMTNLVERLEKLEGWISSLRDDRALAKGSLGKFSDRLDALEKGKVETAPREIPKGMTHKQMAEICDVSVYAVTKMAHDRSKWPEGYMWSDESKKWFPMEV